MPKKVKSKSLYYESGSLAVALLLANVFIFRSWIIDVVVIFIIISTTYWMNKNEKKRGNSSVG